MNSKILSMKTRIAAFATFMLVLVASLSSAQHPGKSSQKKVMEYKAILGSLLPKDTDIKGWKVISGPNFFEPRNLWEHINGQAEMYLDYGFELVAVGEYEALDSSKSMAIEIYQMESPKHSFGIYAAERNPDDNFIIIGTQGYLSENALIFWKGPYYVKLISFQSTSETKDILLKPANFIDKKIEGSYSEPELFACFPEKNRIKMSERFIPKNFLGLSFLKDGYRVEYERGGNNFEVFLVKSDTLKIAKEVFGKYEDFLKSQHDSVSHSKKYGYETIFTGSEKVDVLFRYRFFVGGVLNSADLPKAESIIEQIVLKLKTGCP